VSFGLQTFDTGGDLLFSSPDALSGIFLGVYTTTGSASATYSITGIPGGANLRVLQVNPGSHDTAVGTDGSGNGTLIVTARLPAAPAARLSSVHAVFAISTTEPDFGVNITNSSGGRVISTLYPYPEFLGKITFSTTPTSSVQMFDDFPYWRYRHTTASTLGDGRTRMVLWKQPITSADVWFQGSRLGGTSYDCDIYCPTSLAGTYAMPEAYLFALDGFTPSAGFGLQVFNAAGALTFDSARGLLLPTSFPSQIGYPTTTGTINQYTGITALQGFTPAYSIPGFSFEQYTVAPPNTRNIRTEGLSRRTAQDRIDTKLIITLDSTDPGTLSGGFVRGNSASLMQVVVDTARYGG